MAPCTTAVYQADGGDARPPMMVPFTSSDD
jgi:hypothetical protein